jgi:hypothetical protein
MLLLAASTCAFLATGALVPIAASASFSEPYGGYSICGSNCYIQSAAAHTFIVNEGWTNAGSPALACQLFNHSGANEVTHGSGYCVVYYFGGAFVTARVYNQSGASYTVYGYAET